MQPTPAGSSFEVQGAAFEAIAVLGDRTGAQGGAAALAQAGVDYVVELATQHALDSAFCTLWRALVLAGDSPQKIYQTPEFFQFLRETVGQGDRLELISVSRRADGTLVGVVPVRLGPQSLVFGVGPITLCSKKIEMINVLGSIPAVPSCPALAQHLLTRMLVLFPTAQAVLLQSLPMNSAHWRHVASTPSIGAALMGPWRDCHTLPLPENFDLYMGKFSSKKRYNLNRQIRQLDQQAGALVTQRISQSAHVAGMMASLRELLPAERLSSLLQPSTFEALASKALLLCFVLRAGDEVLAVVVGTRSPHVWHVHNIFVTNKHMALSVGTTALHLAIKELMTEGCFRLIDFGYGTPNHDFRSSHVLDPRAQVLLFDRKRPARWLFRAHSWFSLAAEGVIARVKSWRKAWLRLSNSKPAAS